MVEKAINTINVEHIVTTSCQNNLVLTQNALI